MSVRELLEEAERFVRDELECRETSFLTPSGEPDDDGDGSFEDYVVPARELLAKLQAALSLPDPSRSDAAA